MNNNYYRVYYRVQVITNDGQSVLMPGNFTAFVDVESEERTKLFYDEEDDFYFFEEQKTHHDIECIRNDFFNQFSPPVAVHNGRAYVGVVDLVEAIGFDLWPEKQNLILKLYY